MKKKFTFLSYLIIIFIINLSLNYQINNAQEKKPEDKNNTEKPIPDKTNTKHKIPIIDNINPPFLPTTDAASNYTFTYSTGTYSTIAGTVSTATGDDGTQLLTLPFTLVYDGVNYTQITISTNGAIGMGTLNPSYSNDLASTTARPVIAPLWDDLYDDATSNLQYTTQGTTPNRVYVVQWTGILWYLSGGTRQNFQVRFYETTNVIQFIYGAMLAPAGSPSASIGISDAVGGSTHFISVTPAATPTYSTTVANNSINAVTYLTSGRTYTYTPPGYCPAGASVQDEAITNVTVGTINNTTAWSTGGYGNYTALSTNMTIGTGYTISVNTSPYYTGDITGIWVDWNKNFSFLDAGEYFTTSVTNPAIGTITPPVSALTGTTRMRVRMQYQGTLAPCGTTTYGEVEDYTVNVIASSGMTYVSSITTQTVTSGVSPNSVNNQIVGVQIVTSGASNPFNATSFSLNTTGSTNPPTDITNAKLWYTGISSVFATTTQFGSTIANPNGAFTINGTQTLQNGTNYFWLTYDIKGTATLGNVVDAQCTQIVMSGTGGTRVPSITNPAGNRPIVCAPTIGTGTLSFSNPFNTYWFGARTQMLYLASEITGASSCAGCGNINQIGFNIQSYATQAMNGFNIRMKNTTLTSMTGYDLSGWTTVYSGIYTVPGTGWQYITLTTPFPWDGISNLLVEICFGNTSYTSATNVYASTTSQSMVAYMYHDLSTMCTEVDYYTTTTRPNINLSIGAGTNMSYSSSTTTQSVTSSVTAGTNNNQIICVQIVTSDGCNPLIATSFNFNTNGSSNPPTDISRARLFYTGTNNTLDTTNEFGSFTNPNGSYTVNGSRVLQQGTNYFWLTYNVPSGATNGNFVDAECTSFNASGARTPTVTAPAGNRQITTPLSGLLYVGTGQPYLNLTGPGGLFEAINNGLVAGNLTAYVTSNTTELGTNALNKWSEVGGNGYTLRIVPLNGTEKVLSGNVANAMIRLNGPNKVIIDGSYSGSGKYLRFRNTNGAYPTVLMYNEARNDSLKNCIFESNNVTQYSIQNQGGTINIGNTTGANGNDSNTIYNCDIRDRSDAAGYQAYGIVSYNSTYTTTAQYNSDNRIENCNIYNFWVDGNYAGAIVITIGTGDNWVLSGNSIYQTNALSAVSGLVSGWNTLWLNFTGINNATISNNYIGGSAPLCGGTAWTCTSTAGLQFPGIRLYIGTVTTSNIQGNTIANMDFTTTPNASASTLPWVGILVQLGLVNIGNISANTIGSSAGNNNIKITYAGTYNLTQTVRGIDHRATGNIINNIIGSITIAGTIPSSTTFDGISYVSTPTIATSINGNLIGSNNTANSIQITSSTLISVLNGIVSSVATATCTISSNIVSNLTNNSTSASSQIRGIYVQSTGLPTVSANTIQELSTASTYTGNFPTGCAAIGIVNTNSGLLQQFTSNTIKSIRSTTSGAFNTAVMGYGVSTGTGTGTFSRNRIYDLTNNSTGTAPLIYGINQYTGSWNNYNNQLIITNGEISDNMKKTNIKNLETKTNNYENNKYTLSNKDYSVPLSKSSLITTDNHITNNNVKNSETGGDVQIDAGPIINIQPDKKENSIITDLSTNGIQIQGIHDESGASSGMVYYYNSIYIGGSQSSGISNSYCYYRHPSYSHTVTFRNNLFFNGRINSGTSTGQHFAIGNESATPATGWTAAASNYNTLITFNPFTAGEWVSGTSRTIEQWRGSSGGDSMSWSTTASNIPATNLFTNIANGNLNINTSNQESWIVSGKGIALASMNLDYNGDVRVTTVTGGCTDIGSDEFGTPAVPPLFAIQTGTPGNGSTTTYSLWSRILCIVNWYPNGTIGTTYPSSLNVRYFSGVNPPSPAGNYSNSYIDITPVGTSDVGYNITYMFGDNETYTITTPSTNTILAKKETTGNWEVFPTWLSGGTMWKSQRNYNSNPKTLKVDSLYAFSSFALTDATQALPVLLLSFDARANGRNVTLTWTTEAELNNKEFQIERTLSDKNVWAKTGSIQGYGTTNEKHAYVFEDKNLNTAKYKYRLKQIDYNSNSEYFELNSVVEIGKPVNFDVSQNYPNPSNPKSKIDYQLPFDGKITMKIYDIIGKEVGIIISDNKLAGYYTTEFDGSYLSSGVYFYVMILEGRGQKLTKTMKMILVK